MKSVSCSNVRSASAIADNARREFNDRLKAAKVLAGRWMSGPIW